MRELTAGEVEVLTAGDIVGNAALFVYTPLCGTCQLAGRMLEIVETMLPDLPLYKINLNFSPELGQHWRLRSVPCLVLLEAGQAVRIEYKMASVDHLYLLLKPLMN